MAAALFTAASLLSGQQTPLTSLPYTPSLEPAFMDKAADPCVDFYQYSCGRWNKLNPIPPDQSHWDVYSKLEEENQRLLWGLLEIAARPSPRRTKVEQETGDFFHACMDEKSIQAAGARPIEPALKRIAALTSIKVLAPLIAREHLAGDNVLFGFGSHQDYDDSSRVIAFAEAGGLGLPDRDYYLKNNPKSRETRQRYISHVERMLELLGDSPAAAAVEARQVMSIETALAKASLTRVERRNPYNLKHKMTREKVAAMDPAFDWDAYFAQLGAPPFRDVNVTEPAFFAELNTLLQTEPLDAWKAYLRWHVVNASASYRSIPFDRENFDFYGKYLTGVTQMRPRWMRCVEWTDNDLGEALGQVFVAKTFGPSLKQDALDMTHQVQSAMEQEIQHLDWMTDATKQHALVKLHAVTDKIGYPDKWRDYSSVKLTRGDFFGDVLNATEFESRRQLNKIGKPVDRGEWGMTPPTVNAYYDPQMNDINFPAGVLQPPLFDPKMDAAPNYGNTGATIGHELTHGFDDEGRQFDAHGNLKDWWTPADAKAFQSRVDCVAKQYARYTVVDDIKINSRLTLGEDVADLGGTLLAYIAWKHATEGQNLAAAGGLTPDQRFFVGMAQWACGYERPARLRMHAAVDPHSPEKYRINGVVANLPQFGQAFGCKTGQPMVRVHACKVW